MKSSRPGAFLSNDSVQGSAQWLPVFSHSDIAQLPYCQVIYLTSDLTRIENLKMLELQIDVLDSTESRETTLLNMNGPAWCNDMVRILQEFRPKQLDGARAVGTLCKVSGRGVGCRYGTLQSVSIAWFCKQSSTLNAQNKDSSMM